MGTLPIQDKVFSLLTFRTCCRGREPAGWL